MLVATVRGIVKPLDQPVKLNRGDVPRDHVKDNAHKQDSRQEAECM